MLLMTVYRRVWTVVLSRTSVLTAGLLSFLPMFAADIVPTAFVSEAGRAIVVSGERVELDAASCFDAWAGGVKPAETEREAAYAQWGDYANWNADFVVTFDRAVAAGSVALYGQTVAFGEEWLPLAIEKDLAAGAAHCLLKDGFGVTVPYLGIAEEIVRFTCGVKNLSAANAGTTMTIELRLSDPDSTETRTLARRTCTFRKEKKPNWFDARIADYRSWPEDAALAVGGEWRSDEGTLGEVAAVETAGVLSVDATKLRFAVKRPRPLAEMSGVVRVSGDVDFGVNDAEALPAVEPKWKGSVIRVRETAGDCYYGLAMDGASNVWKKLTGPAPTDGPVRFEMALWSRAGLPVVTYTVNGADYRLNGKRVIPVAASGEVEGVSIGGEGTLTSLSGAVERGFVVMVK